MPSCPSKWQRGEAALQSQFTACACGCRWETHSGCDEPDLPVYSLQCRVQVLLHMEEKGSCGGLLNGVRQSDDPAVISKPFPSLKKDNNQNRHILETPWTLHKQRHCYMVFWISWDYLLHLQQAVLQNVLIGQGHRRPLSYIQTLVFQITGLLVFRQFVWGGNCDHNK